MQYVEHGARTAPAAILALLVAFFAAAGIDSSYGDLMIAGGESIEGGHPQTMKTAVVSSNFFFCWAYYCMMILLSTVLQYYCCCFTA